MKKYLLAAALAMCSVTSASADSLFGDFKRLPNDIERGFSVGGDFGLLFLSGDPLIRQTGFQLAFTTGYDIMKYLTIEGVYMMGINEADPFVRNGGVNTFLFDVAAKGAYPLGRLYPFAEVGVGMHYSSPELPGGQWKPNLLFGGGLEYYTYLRHYSVYLKTTYAYIFDQDINGLAIALGLKYTF